MSYHGTASVSDFVSEFVSRHGFSRANTADKKERLQPLRNYSPIPHDAPICRHNSFRPAPVFVEYGNNCSIPNAAFSVFIEFPSTLLDTRSAFVPTTTNGR